MRIRYAEEAGALVKKALVYTKGEHGINAGDVDPEAALITGRLKAAGHDAYVVGGAVRDLLLGKKPKDFDIATDASPGKIKKVFRNARIIGHRFRLVHVYFGPRIFEVSTFRSLKDGPTSNTFGTIEEDVLRRDFTLNALFYDPQEEVVVDYIDGMRDIRKKRIRPIIPLQHIFTDDPVRMIRAVKYAASTGFRIPFSLGRKIRAQAGLLAGISPSRLTEEIFKIIRSSCPAKIASALDSYGLYQYLQPEAVRLFRAQGGFRERYMRTLASLSSPGFKDAPGAVLSSLVRDYVEDCVEWDSDFPSDTLIERFKDAFAKARHFVLPMNPPRVELFNAMRLIFADHGLTVTKFRLGDRRHQFRRALDGGADGERGAPDGKPPAPQKPQAAAASRPASGGAEGAAAAKKRKRRSGASRSGAGRRQPPAPAAG
ncbi:MAG: polynucleotide adenylyltransferase PcnB [Treponema sp.]|jgi:poly(A) polymerase|nr:polynucleotide adenylyltransferase PcnB [Treponema sp.]